MKYQYQPLILIGAARSGTKLLRDIIAQHPDVSKIPYDINYIWRLGNEKVPHDELSPDMLMPEISQRILRYCDRYCQGTPVLIEKTVSNCLRIPFVHKVFPDAKFIHLVRDGRDVVESVYRQWLAPPDWGYIVRKAFAFPLTEAFGYAFSYACNILAKAASRQSIHAGTWGPRYQGIEHDVQTKELLAVCAIQWVKSIQKAGQSLDMLPAGKVLTLHYEEFVQAPWQHLETVANFVGINPRHYPEDGTRSISTVNIGKGQRQLRDEQMSFLLPVIREALTSLKYQ